MHQVMAGVDLFELKREVLLVCLSDRERKRTSCVCWSDRVKEDFVANSSHKEREKFCVCVCAR